jgi:hypothetical protein
MLIKEKMRWVIEYCQWQARWWAERATIRGGEVDDQLLEGLQSYAAEQASIEWHHAVQLEAKWAPVRSWAKAALSQVSATHTASTGLSSIEVEINNDYDMEFGDDNNSNN